MTDNNNTDQDLQEYPEYISGRLVVSVIFGFSIIMIAVLFFYWKMQTGPFLPLQKALDKQFPGCKPLVQGGQRKMHKNTPKILQITMKVEFNPIEVTDSSKKYVNTVSQFIASNWKLSEYDELHLHFYKLNPEKKLQENVFKQDVKEILSQKESS